MKRIIKNAPPASFESWKDDFKKVNGRDAVYDDFVGVERQKLKMHLLEEQYGLCCYCMKRVSFGGDHLEHIMPRSTFPQNTMDYMNMVILCNGSDTYQESNDTCGHKRGNWYGANYISPLDELVETYFTYDMEGNIYAKDNSERAQEMINRLELNCYSLKEKRHRAIYMALIKSDDSLDDVIEDCSTPTNGELPEYCMAILYCALEEKERQLED